MENELTTRQRKYLKKMEVGMEALRELSNEKDLEGHAKLYVQLRTSLCGTIVWVSEVLREKGSETNIRPFYESLLDPLTSLESESKDLLQNIRDTHACQSNLGIGQ